MPEPKKYLDYVGLTEYTSLLKDYISDQQHTIDGYYDVTTTHKFYKNYDAGTFSNEITGAFGNIYVDLLTNKLYKYDNNAYVEITTSVSTNFENSGVNAGTVTINGTSSTIKVPTGDTSSTVAVGNHTHNTTIATDSGTSTVDMSANTTYKLTAGGTNVIFKTPIDTTYVFDGTYDASTNKAATVSTVTNAISELPEPMVFKGSLGTGGTITTLPTASSSNKGYVYKVITAGTYASQSAKDGDTFISDGSAWVLIPSGDEPDGTVTNVAVANGGGLTVSGSPITSSGTITVGHSNSVTAKTSSSVKKFTYDAYGHITGSSELSTAESDALASGIDSTKVTQIETNKNNILSLEQMNGAKNKFNYDAWKNCGVFQGTKTVNGNSFTLVASGEDCFTYYENNEPRQYPINARIPCNAGDKVVLTWEYTPLSSQSDDRVGIFANGSASTGFFALVSASNKKLEFTAPTGTTYLSIRFGVLISENSATYGNIQIQSKASYDAGFTDYQPYALSNAELTAKEQSNENNISSLDTEIDTVANLGAKNLLDFGKWASNVPVYNGTKTYSNGVMTVTATGSGCVTYHNQYFPEALKISVKEGEKYTITWDTTVTTNIGFFQLCPNGNAISGTDVSIANKQVEYTVGSGVTYLTYRVGVWASGNSIDISKLMLRPSSISNFTYQPYAMSNAELTAKEQQNENNILSAYGGIVGKNLFNINDATEAGKNRITAIIENDAITVTNTGNYSYVSYPLSLKAGTYRISATISDYEADEPSSCFIVVAQTSNASGTYLASIPITGNGNVSALFTINANKTVYITYCPMLSAASGTNTFKIANNMIMKNGDDTAYQPYIYSNAELTAAIQAIQAQLANQ